MVKLIGVLLIISSMVAMAAGAFIEQANGSNAKITGNVIFNLVTQPEINLGLLDYVEAIAFSYSFFSFIMGIVFLVKV